MPTTNYITIINLLKERGLIDAIGDQAHAFSTTEAAPMNNHRNNLNRLAATGLPIYITELDIDGVLAGVVNDPVQVANFQRIFPTFWEHPAVKGVTIWGYVRGFHWRNAQGDWLLYPNGGERPALQWLIRYVRQHAGGGGSADAHGERVRGGRHAGGHGDCHRCGCRNDVLAVADRLGSERQVRDRCGHGHREPGGGCVPRFRDDHFVPDQCVGLGRLRSQRARAQ